MATINKRKGIRGITFNVKIRKKGYPPLSRSFKTLAEAKEWVTVTELAMTRGEAPRDRTAHEMTVGQALERYSKEIMPHHRGKRSESYRVKALLQSRLADVTFAELNSKIISSWRDGRLKTVTGGSVLRELTILRAVIRAARSDWGVSLVEDPMKFVRKPRDNQPRERVITPDEEARLYEECNKVRNKLLRPAIEWAILSCMRQGEQFSMTWTNVNIDQRFVFLPMTKNGTARQVPLSLRMMEILRSLRQVFFAESVVHQWKNDCDKGHRYNYINPRGKHKRCHACYTPNNYIERAPPSPMECKRDISDHTEDRY
ncbi:tyrosine-type recombinase/integrase [Burkholderia anthina]|uniref:tyrosine-type recombinase/integrase n=1 Tax=Burkholderia anthina TaxID=179879 RepID=UPI001AA04CE0|nr:tyrosine-type recombinase/integrase [Burkholderia anthina]QTD94160.1 tyrosine-type recombinase/integrase [Burkholderia anthina]